MNKELIYKELSESIIGAAKSVLNSLKLALLLNFKNAKLEWKRIVH